MRYEGSFDEYRSEINAMMERVAEWSTELSNPKIIETVNKVLDWVEDRAGQEVGLHELGSAIGDKTGGLDTMLNMGPLMGGKPMMEAFFKVEGPDGTLYLLDDVYKASEGETYVSPATGELLASSRDELETISYPYFRIADFTRDHKPGM